MKKLLCTLLAFLLLVSVINPSFTALAVEESTGLTISAATDGYTSYDPGVVDFPYTFEATISFPAETSASARGGVILGSYIDASTPCFNFEIHKNGNPRIYAISEIVDDDGNNLSYDIIFDQVNVYTGEIAHIAVTLDYGNKLWSCYLNGALAQTITAKEAPEPYYITKPVCIAGDTRNGNAQYFKGTIYNLALYSDARTADEVAADAVADVTTVDTDGLTHYYDMSGITAGQLPSVISSPLGLGPAFKYGVPGENPDWWITDSKPVTNYAYSFAIVGDPQVLNLNYPEKMDAMYSWIAANKESKNIQFCLTLGDLTDDNTAAEYNRIISSFEKLDAVGLPYSFVRGNHDKVDNFDKYITYDQFGQKTPESGSFDGTMKNTWQKLTVGQLKYMFVNVDYQAKSDVLAQISAFIAENADCNVIVSTHVYMNSRTNLTTALRWEQKSDKDQLAGLDFWEQLFSKHNNIVMVLCGHSPSSKILTRNSVNANGYNIPQVLVDCQEEDKALGGLGMVAMFYFSEDGSQVQVRHYSVDRDALYRKESQFTMNLNVVNTDGTITPSVPVAAGITKVYNLRRAGDLTNAATAVSTAASEFEAGYKDWMIAAHHSGFSTGNNKLQIKSGHIYAGYTAYAAADPKWIAFQLRSPGAGTYQISVASDTVSTTDKRTGAPMNVYLIPASQVPAEATEADYAALMTNETKIGYYSYGTGNTVGNFGTHTIGDGDYIMILQGAGTINTSIHANNFYLKSITFSAKGVTVGTQHYDNLSDAVTNAKSGDTVTLLSEASIDDLLLPDGVTLDLCGNTLTVNNFSMLPDSDSKIIDTANGGGLLKVVSENATFLGSSPFAENALPIYDAESGGYRFFQYKYIRSSATVQKVADDKNAAKFYYQFQFTDKQAYKLIAKGDSGIKMGILLRYGEDQEKEYIFKSDSSSDLWSKNWGSFAATANNPWLWVIVKNAYLAENVSVVPYVTAAGVDVCFNPIIIGEPDISDDDFGWNDGGPLA